jgi:DNA-binding NarL/FixJ family response regulator
MTTRILIADDDAPIRGLVRRILEEHPGWEVCGEAIDGQEAVSKTLALAPDIVVLDLAMPEKNGLQAAREIAQASPHLPMVLLTVEDSTDLTLAAQEAGIRLTICKSNGTEVVQGIEWLLHEQHRNPPRPSHPS